MIEEQIAKELYDQQCKTHYYHEGTWYPKALETRYDEDERRRERVEAALKRFEEHFKSDGKAKTAEGEVMADRAQRIWAKAWMTRLLRVGRPRIIDRSEK
jgi:ribosomal protein L44E